MNNNNNITDHDRNTDIDERFDAITEELMMDVHTMETITNDVNCDHHQRAEWSAFIRDEIFPRLRDAGANHIRINVTRSVYDEPMDVHHDTDYAFVINVQTGECELRDPAGVVVEYAFTDEMWWHFGRLMVTFGGYAAHIDDITASMVEV